MKRYFSSALLIFLCVNLLACRDRQSNENEINESDLGVDTVNLALSPIVKRVIDDFDDYFGFENPDGIIYDISIYDGKDGPLLMINWNLYYHKDDIIGYSYWKDHLIVYYEYCSECNLGYIDKNQLIPFADSIPGYKDYTFAEEQFDPVKQEYLIHSPDSLELIYSGSF